ncbi:hypothetical protein [Pleionea sediminis]|uniref:hypothetical protein n=1 Tax=Pleionea sediminis TaxID=2569479 RepID=UPI00118524F6|nr:hypothetical protein [Pleionea sediminis]
MRIAIIFITLISMSSFAEIRFDGKSYIACNTCISDLDFKNAARSHHMALFPRSHLNPRNIDTYVVLNEFSEEIKTVKLRRHYVVFDDEYIGPYTGGNSAHRFFTHLESQVRINQQVDINFLRDYSSTSDIDYDYDPKRPEVTHQFLMERYSKKVNYIWLRNIFDVSWYANPYFHQVGAQINEEVASRQINPLFYARSKLKVRIYTSDEFVVNMVNGGIRHPNEWAVAYARDFRGERTKGSPPPDLLDSNWNVISSGAPFDQNMECFVSEGGASCVEESGFTFFGPIHSYSWIDGGIIDEPPTPTQCQAGQQGCGSNTETQESETHRERNERPGGSTGGRGGNRHIP